MERESIIKKVQALRAQSKDKAVTVEEAATFARLAELLIQKYTLEEADLESVRVTREEIGDDESPLTDWDQREVMWQNILIHNLCKAYNCTSIIKWSTQNKIGMYAIGRKSDIELLRYQYAFFTVELVRLAHLMAPKDLKRGSGKTWYNSFYRGAVHAIVLSLESAKKEVRAQATSSSLIVVDSHIRALSAYRENKYGRMGGSKSIGGNIDPDAYAAGMQAGSNLNAKPGLAPGVRGLLK